MNVRPRERVTRSNFSLQSLDLEGCTKLLGISALVRTSALTLTMPIERIKIIQQAHSEKGFFSISKDLYRQGGIRSFYIGSKAEATKIGAKLFLWPLIMETKRTLNYLDVPSYYREGLTGLAVGTSGVLVTAPLERVKFAMREQSGEKINLKNGWYGCCTQLRKVSFQWSTFLMFQEYYKTRRLQTTQTLGYLDLLWIGICTSFSVALLSAPLDRAHTLRQVHKLSFTEAFRKEPFWKMYKGAHLIALTGVVNCTTSSVILDWIDRRLEGA